MPTLLGVHKWSMQRDTEGFRIYKIVYKISSSVYDGPANVLSLTPGLPIPGSIWFLSGSTEVDLWAWCRWDATVTPMVDGELNDTWFAEFTFSTRPYGPQGGQGGGGHGQSCKDQQAGDPLLEPTKINGGSSKYMEQAVTDRRGKPILNSAFERIRGQQVEFDCNRPQVKIQFNVASFNLALFTSMIDTVNKYPLWGLSKRKIKLSNFTWGKNFYGSCYIYYTLSFDFDIRYETFDKDVADEGTKALRGKWNGDTWDLINIGGSSPNPKNPAHFIAYRDKEGELATTILNGRGIPATSVSGTGKRYVSVSSGNIGMPLDDTEFWLPWWDTEATGDNDPADYPDWDEDTVYDIGDLVNFSSVIYICAERDPQVDPPSGSGFEWVALTSGTSDEGLYNAGTTYDVGHVVQDTAAAGAGKIHIEKYRESDFLLLGIPASL